ncbi:MAG: bifunctional DNA-formamidopyrimidine glycosylase/DNA-(apurinic or apyrimidinic site) lyase [Chromatiales bacterium]|jgi:formamidopyrimidine-DNA glycosylase|nr:bifunctional DNA-formamidopyrimidine glycosylase/DNA-(apurinic or apyrimidinic site) lyase [Chromatiales bacterium]MDH3895470.1 bifunctional DNA-formamidopyrimidine glycosylase/DNA-(apurinic or apyrimidinic site) lyase [Chromatiales bacterium]MDH3931012.1 bifunctional DNA-formamidopyrimidine glycosylase/DNA-(apurinic or apyrimidinic site) lyase [Chromatiales bacterium]MDH3945345.1 bifunctional DNA-formamidopyrimidine glycosylase/DNA-(apurinic or apyrimidinic site) lyase [Chromatiales bacteriu
MPELPEVETTRRGVAPHISGRTVRDVVVRERRLRWEVPRRLPAELRGTVLAAPQRRGKYLLFPAENGTAIMHLGMSGSLRMVIHDTPPAKHDHIDIVLDGPYRMRYNDPRRFGALLWTRADPLRHPRLARLGPEPFDPVFCGDYLRRLAHRRKTSIKQFIMDASVVVGVGNIYANEALYRAGINPARGAGRVGAERMSRLARAATEVLGEAIEAGGTTLRNFVGGDGEPGYFQFDLDVYGREGQPCSGCGTAIRRRWLGQRATFFCPACQR